MSHVSVVSIVQRRVSECPEGLGVHHECRNAATLHGYDVGGNCRRATPSIAEASHHHIDRVCERVERRCMILTAIFAVHSDVINAVEVQAAGIHAIPDG